ncbi:SigB/SigF/SigG family RNA polymerase sigma factor [Kribbella voronezhensis]|nr:SigB/SigF/SigG family RNA polymerase sigma factor [Kribbella voronezhensis]
MTHRREVMMATSTSQSEPARCSSARERTEREAATSRLFEQRERTTDETERQALLEQIVELNLEIAKAIAHRFDGRGAESEDLVQVACVGLMKAARQYRLSADTPFIGYAVPTIRGEVKRYFRDCAWTVRIPRRLQELQGALIVKTPMLQQELNREPTVADLAEYLGVEAEEIDQARAARGCFNTLSLDRALPNDDRLKLGDVIPDDPDQAVDQLEAVDMLRPVLAELSQRDRQILHLRFVEGWTQTEIGREIGISQMQVSRVLRQILQTLRAKLTPLPNAA